MIQQLVSVDPLASDTTPPTVVITDSLAGTANRASAAIVYTLTFSEPVDGLTAEDFTVANGTLGALAGSGTIWTINVTPVLGVATGTIALTLKDGAVSDAAGNLSDLAVDTGQTIDTLAPVAPKLITGATFDFLVDPQVTLQTNYGNVVLELNPELAPITVANLLAYVDIGFYDDTLMHRVIPNFVVQGGGFGVNGSYRTPLYDPLPLESNNGLTNLRGTVAMARTSEPNSATSQFFVNLVDNASLNYVSASAPGYTVFGEVITGMTVIDAIAQVATTTSGSYQNVPAAPVVIDAIDQTVAGSSVSSDGTLQISGLETGGGWAYSLDGGVKWNLGSGSSLVVPAGAYAPGAIRIRQADAAGNISWDGRLTSALTVEATAPQGKALYQTEAGGYVIDVAGLTGGEFTDALLPLRVGTKVYAPQLAPVGLLEYENGTFGVVARAGTRWAEQSFTGDGLASGKAVKLTLPQLLAKELLSGEDFDGDGKVGDTVVTVCDAGGNDGVGLYQTKSGAYVVDAAALSVGDTVVDPLLLLAGTKLYAPKVVPSALLVYENGTGGVIAGAGTSWTEQSFTSDGLANGKAAKLTLPQVLVKETRFGEDINGDGRVGDTIAAVFDSGGNDDNGLYKTTSGGVVIDQAGLAAGEITVEAILLLAGKKGYAPKVAPAALLEYDDGRFGVIAGAGTKWTEQLFGSDGLASGKAAKLTFDQVMDKEDFFNEDINGDNTVGDIALLGVASNQVDIVG